MNLKQDWTSTQRGLAAACALSFLLAATPGCAGEDPAIDPSERPDNLARGRASTAQPDAGSVRDEPANATCQAEPGKPAYPDAGVIYPPKPGEAPSSGNAGVIARDCFGALVGDGKTCLSDLDLKLQGQKLCEAKGYQLTDLKLGEADCAGGSSQGWLSCCATVAPDQPTAMSCSGGMIGDGSACIDWTSIKLKASAACEALGAGLTALAGSSDDKCPDGALWAKYECRTSSAPPRPTDPIKEPWLK